METPADRNWIYHPNPLAEEEVKLDITRIADAKTAPPHWSGNLAATSLAALGLPSSDHRHVAR